ncbi:MAG TPA: peptidylprolyl isomerase [Candidatus Dormibacteraeota bacterium]|nr:peptidylprolyl isomerase [Candidatus Dormibacteraeota bacterium]
MKQITLLLLIFLPAAALSAQEGGKVVEEIVARVNNEVITLSDLRRARGSADEDGRQECPRCTPEQLQTLVGDKDKNALRDLIDQSLLVQRAKDMGVSVESELVKKLDQIRQQNNLPDMEALEKAVTSQGTNFEDFKNNLRNHLLTELVIGREVSSRIMIDKSAVQQYYNEHKSEFIRPEQVYLREIFVSTEGKTEAEIPALEKKANDLLEKIKNGDDFAELARRRSDGSTAKQGGELGLFKRGELSKEIEDAAFPLKKNEYTEVIRSKQGFLFLQVQEHYDAGLQPLAKVEPEIMNKLYQGKMDPALRKYLKTLREESYVVVKPGYVDSAGASGTPIQEVQAQPEESKIRKGHKKFGVFGKRKNSGA